MPRVEPNCQTHERKAREVLGYDGKDKELDKKIAGRISKADLLRNHEVGGKDSQEKKGNCWKRNRVWEEVQGQQYLRRMWEHFTVKRAWAKAVLSDADKERQEGIQGNWQKDSPFKQELELVKRSSDLS